MASSHKVFYKNTLMQYGLQIAKYLFPFITIPYLTRVLGPDVYAIRAYILAAMTFMQVFLDYGFTSYGTRAVALAINDKTAIRSEMTAIMIARFGLCIGGAIVLVPITLCIPILASNPVYVAISYICVCFKAALPDFIFTGLEEMGILTYRFVVAQAVSTVLILLMVRGVEDLLLVPTFEALAAFIAFSWSWENVLLKRRIAPIRVSASKVISAFKVSTVFFFSNAATTLFTCLTTLMIGVLITDISEVSYWSLAMTAISAIQSLYIPISNSLYPHMCKRRDFALFKRLMAVGMAVVTVGTVAFASFSEAIMWILGGSEYLNGAYVMVMVSPVLFFSFPAVLQGVPMLAAVGKEKELTASSIISALFHISGLFVLAFGGWFTISAVAVLRCCTEFVLFLMRTIFVVRWFRLRKGGDFHA